MATYTIQVSNHGEAGSRIPTEAASRSWEIKYDGPIASDKEARSLADALSAWYRHVRVFKHSRQNSSLGRYWYAVLDTRREKVS